MSKKNGDWRDISVDKVPTRQPWEPEFRPPESTKKARHNDVFPVIPVLGEEGWGEDTSESLKIIANHSSQISDFRFPERHCLKKIKMKWEKERTFNINLWPPQSHTLIRTPPTHTKMNDTWGLTTTCVLSTHLHWTHTNKHTNKREKEMGSFILVERVDNRILCQAGKHLWETQNLVIELCHF